MKNSAKKALTGAFLLLVALAAYGLFSFQARSHALEEAAQTANNFLHAMNAHDYVDAHGLLDVPHRTAESMVALQLAEERVEEAHGKPLGTIMVDEYHVNLNLTTVILSCEATHRGATVPVRITLVKTSSGWRVSEYHYDFSPA